MEGGLACLFRKSPDTELLKLVMEGTDLKTIQENNVLPELRDDDALPTKKAAILRLIQNSAIFPRKEREELETKINNLDKIDKKIINALPSMVHKGIQKRILAERFAALNGKNEEAEKQLEEYRERINEIFDKKEVEKPAAKAFQPLTESPLKSKFKANFNRFKKKITFKKKEKKVESPTESTKRAMAKETAAAAVAKARTKIATSRTASDAAAKARGLQTAGGQVAAKTRQKMNERKREAKAADAATSSKLKESEKKSLNKSLRRKFNERFPQANLDSIKERSTRSLKLPRSSNLLKSTKERVKAVSQKFQDEKDVRTARRAKLFEKGSEKEREYRDNQRSERLSSQRRGGKLKTRKRKSRGKSRSTIKRKRIKKPKTKSNRKKYRQTNHKKYKRIL